MAKAASGGGPEGRPGEDEAAPGAPATAPDDAAAVPTPEPKAKAKAKAKGQAASPPARKAKAKAKAARPRGKKAQAAAARAERRRWGLATLALILGLLALRIWLIALDLVPPHFDEAQYWAYGQELAWGYYSKPPGVAAAIRLTTELFGDGSLGLRLSSPVSHALIALAIFATAARIWDGRTGFWAAAAYSAAPGVTASALIVSTDPIMMAGWAWGLYALVRAGEGGAGRHWWALTGLALGLAFLAKYTAIAFAVAAIGYGLFSARGRDWTGAAIAAGAALAVAAPNIAWQLGDGFGTVAHVAEDADPGQGYGNPIGFLEFLGAQLGVIGPVVFVTICLALWRRRGWSEAWGMRLMAWQTGALLIPIALLALLTRAQPNWAAPAYIGGTILATRWLLDRGALRLLAWGQVGLGLVAGAVILGLAALYAADGERLPRIADPFKKMRIGPPFCAPALAAMAEQGAEVLLSDNRRRLSECMLLGGLGWDRVAIWNPDGIDDNHHESVATLYPGDDRTMLLAVIGVGRAAALAERFERAEEIDAGRFATHGDRDYAYALWLVSGFRGYSGVE